VLRKQNRHMLRSRGTVVFLDVEIETQVERTSRNNSRPLLRQGDIRETLLRIREQRGPLYNQVAHIKIGTSTQRHQKVVDRIVQQLDKLDNTNAPSV